ncbi:MAG: hypothetical protein ACYDDN_01960 [Candidatus Desulforudaceae bacterium]|jgi:hypothetical protein
MAFVNQIQPVNFFDQKIKALRVICQERVNESGDLVLPFINTVVDPELVEVTITEVGMPVITNLEALRGKVVNVGFVPVTLTITVGGIIDLVDITVNVPFQGVIECPGVLPGDNIQKHDIQVLGVIDTVVTVATIVNAVFAESTALNLKVVVELCVVISREEVLKVNASNLFC